jgi:hypothetical protein
MGRIRSYQKAVEIPLNKSFNLSDITGQKVFEEVFVILEEPLLELNCDDLGWLRSQGIDIFSE